MVKKGIGYSLLNEAPQSLSKKRFGKETWQLDNDEKLQFAIENCRSEHFDIMVCARMAAPRYKCNLVV